MKNFCSKYLMVVGFLAVSLFSFASEGSAEHSEKTEGKEGVKEFIDHHLQDAYYYELFETGGKKVGFPLPVILWDNGLKMFSSSCLMGEGAYAKKGDDYYRLYHSKIYKTNAEGTLDFDKNHHPTNPHPLDFSITKNVFLIMVVCVLLFLLFRGMARTYRNGDYVPTKAAKFLEPIVLYVRDEIAIPNIGKKKYKRYLPFLLTVFFFIWVANLLGVTPLGANITGNITVTIALAMLTFLITNFTGNKNYWLHILDPLGDSMPWWAKLPLYVILVPIELLAIFIRPFSLFIRLFANMTAGHIVIMSLVAIIFFSKNYFGGGMTFILAFVIMIIEFFVAALQAYIFTMLSSIYFGMASVEGHDDH